MKQRKSKDSRMVVALLAATIILLFGWATAWGAQPARNTAGPAKNYKEGELLVKFKPSVPDFRKNAVHGKVKADKIKEFPELRLHHVKLPAGMSVEDAVKLYAADPDVEYAEPNYIVRIEKTANDPLFSSLWGLNNTGQTGGKPDADIDATEAWDLTTGSSNVVVAVIDSGVDYTHVDLSANIWTNPGEKAGDGIDNDGNGYVDDVHGINAITHTGDPMDDNSHGTHVAGTIGATGNNRKGVVGVNWSVKIIGTKFIDAFGSGPLSAAIECLQYIKALKDSGVNIVATSNSWGCYGCYSQALYDAINAQREILFMAAAGNSSEDNDEPSVANYPSSYDLPNIIAVAATNHKDELSWFSSYGKRTVDVAAPGENILSTVPAAFGFYDWYSGTSMATPHVTGLAALIKAQSPTRDWRTIRNLIFTSGDALPQLAGVTAAGKRINAYKALTCTNNPVLTVLEAPAELAPGRPVTVAALSVNCGLPVGPVTITFLDGSVMTLEDNGVAPDLAAGDGIFSGTWTGTGNSESLRFSSPAGSETIVYPPLKITTNFRLDPAKINVPYTTTLSATGGFSPRTWSIITGQLPNGLALNTSTGTISGTPTAEGPSQFTVRITEATGAKTDKVMRLQVNDYVWSSTYPGEYVKFENVAVDGSGNTVAAGLVFNGSDPDFLVVKYDPAGNMLWSTTYNYSNQDTTGGVAIDPSGNIYVTGHVYDGTSHNFFTIKFDSAGHPVWTKVFDGGFSDGANAVTVDQAGNAYVTGNSEASLYGANNILTIKYDPAGNEVATFTYDGGWDGYGQANAVDPSGNLYVGGTIAGNMLVLKYSAAGALLWSRTYDAGSAEYGNDIAVDASGSAYLAGGMVTEFDEWGNPVDYDFLTTKFDSQGGLVWARTYQEGDQAYGISVDSAGNAYVSGMHETMADFFVVKYDPQGGILWKKFFDTNLHDYSYDVCVDSSNSVYVTGEIYPVSGGTDTDGLTIKFAQPRLDLAVSSLSAPASAAAGSTISVTDTTINAGSAATGGPSVTRFYLSVDAVVDVNDKVLGSRTVPELNAGASNAASTSVQVPAGTARGTYYLIAVSDADEVLVEANESNNAATRTIKIN